MPRGHSGVSWLGKETTYVSDTTKNDKGEITKVTYKDSSGYTGDISHQGDKIRIVTKDAGGAGKPLDLTKDEARRFGHDIVDMAGSE